MDHNHQFVEIINQRADYGATRIARKVTKDITRHATRIAQLLHLVMAGLEHASALPTTNMDQVQPNLVLDAKKLVSSTTKTASPVIIRVEVIVRPSALKERKMPDSKVARSSLTLASVRKPPAKMTNSLSSPSATRLVNPTPLASALSAGETVQLTRLSAWVFFAWMLAKNALITSQPCMVRFKISSEIYPRTRKDKVSLTSVDCLATMPLSALIGDPLNSSEKLTISCKVYLLHNNWV